MEKIIPINSNIEIWKRKDRRFMGWGMFALGTLFGVMIAIIVLLLTYLV